MVLDSMEPIDGAGSRRTYQLSAWKLFEASEDHHDLASKREGVF